MTLFQLLASKLSDHEITELRSALTHEYSERISRRVPTLPALDAGERIAAHGDKFKAIRRYRERCLVTLLEAKAVVEDYLEKNNFTPAERLLIRNGTGAGAIAAISDRLGVSAEQAKVIVEEARRSL